MKIGLILRVFAGKSELVDGAVAKLVATIKKANALEGQYGEGYFSRIDVLVPMDARYKDCDCGETAEAVAGALEEIDVAPIRWEVHEVRSGEIFCSVLNYGVAYQLSVGMAFSVIMSTEVASYLNDETMEEMVDTVDKGAKVVGVALNELAPSIMLGRIANTFAMWDNLALMTVGGFDLAARQAKVNENRPNAGCEEIIPLLRLAELYGPCIAPILPQGEGVKEWKLPTDPDVLARHNKKMRSKEDRQAAHAASIGFSLGTLSEGVMEQYRTSLVI